MKIHLLALAAVILFIQSLFAATPDCATVAGKAAFKKARPDGNRRDSTVIASVGEAKLLKKSGKNLYYRIEIAYDVVGGYSDSFPSEIYAVVAHGDERTCKVTGVKLAK